MKRLVRKQEEGMPWMKLVFSLMVAYIVTVFMIMILALLLYQLNWSEKMISTGISLSYMMSCFVAGNLAGRCMKQKRFMWGIVMGIAYFVALLVISVIGNQSFAQVTDSIFTSLILCIGGGMLGGMLS